MEEILGIFGIDWRLVVIQALNFGFLLGILWYFLYRPVVQMLEERRRKIEEGVINAEKAQKKLLDIEGEKDNIFRDASKEASIIVDEARVRGEEKSKEIVGDAEAKSSRIIKDAEARAEEAKKEALASSKHEIARLAVLAAEKVLREKS